MKYRGIYIRSDNAYDNKQGFALESQWPCLQCYDAGHCAFFCYRLPPTYCWLDVDCSSGMVVVVSS